MEYCPPYQKTKDVTVISDYSRAGTNDGELVSPEGTQEGKDAICQPSDCSHSPWWALRKLRMWEHRVPAPDSWGACQGNDFGEPGLLHLPIYRKVLNSLTWDIWFSLFNDNLFMFPKTCPLLQNIYITWLQPHPVPSPPVPPPRSSSLGVPWDAASRAWSPKDSHRIKRNSQLLCCE